MLLDDVRVVELAVHRAAPFCTALLADMGADVVKIERPGVGDPTRTQGAGPEGKSGYFSALNRNKRSVELNLKTDAGQEAAQELAADADVFIENFGYGVAERLGLGYDRLAEANPELVYASIKGYGKTGPMKEKPGLDLILQAEGGIMSLTGPEDGDPVKVGQAIGDLSSGLFAAVGILARLHEAEQTGEGGQFDVGLFDAIVTLLNEYPTQYDLTGEVPGTQGTSHQTLVPYQLFDTADGQLVLGVPSDDRWDDFVDAVGCETVREYGTNSERMANREEVVGAIQERLNEAPADHWAEVLDEANFPNGPLNDVSEVVDHPQAEARELFARVKDRGVDLMLPNHPLHFPDHDEVGVRGPAPDLGEHTESVFGEVAGDQTTLDEWREGGAFGD